MEHQNIITHQSEWPQVDRINDREDFSACVRYQQRKLTLAVGLLEQSEKITTPQAHALKELLNEVRYALTPVAEYCQQSDEFINNLGG